MKLGGGRYIGGERIGNEAIPKDPLRPPTGGIPSGTQPLQPPSGLIVGAYDSATGLSSYPSGSGPKTEYLPEMVQGFNHASGGVYLPIQRVIFNYDLDTTGGVLLMEPDTMRVYLSIMNLSISAATALIGFGNHPNDIGSDCDVEIPNGEFEMWDFFVPQNRIYIDGGGVIVGGLFVVCDYANVPP